MRPKFEIVVPLSVEEATRRLNDALARPDVPCRGELYGSHALLHIPEPEQHIWSPFLSLNFFWHSDGTRVEGLFGPKPSMWSLFVAAYALCACLAFFALAFGTAQWALGQMPWALLVLPLAMIGILVVYALARFGQIRGRGQMETLRAVLDNALGMRAVAS